MLRSGGGGHGGGHSVFALDATPPPVRAYIFTIFRRIAPIPGTSLRRVAPLFQLLVHSVAPPSQFLIRLLAPLFQFSIRRSGYDFY